jgi:S1-C subfamily serine protease
MKLIPAAGCRWVQAAALAAVIFLHTACVPGERTGKFQGESLTTAEIVRKLAPSVVKLQSSSGNNSASNEALPANSSGTGLIADPVGNIVTCLHVICPGGKEVPDRVLTTLSDRRTLYASVVGTDQRLDLAVLKIDAPGLTPAAFGDPLKLEVGDDVVAIGYAFDLAGPPTVTRGVVSALRRRILQSGLVIPDAIQTDADIHPGNSGGPLANSRGEVIGINTAVASWSRDVGFAVSASVLLPAVESIIRTGAVKRAYLGISTAESSVPFMLGPLQGKGIPVILILEGSPAHEAGLRPGDIIVSIGGESLVSGGDLLPVLARHKPGERVAIEFYREKKQRSVLVTLAEQLD